MEYSVSDLLLCKNIDNEIFVGEILQVNGETLQINWVTLYNTKFTVFVYLFVEIEKHIVKYIKT